MMLIVLEMAEYLSNCVMIQGVLIEMQKKRKKKINKVNKKRNSEIMLENQ